MPRRETKRGARRTPLAGDYDVLICGASFAGLAVARELAGSGARVLVIDRYEIGERQTSACAAPTEWLEAMGVAGAMRQTFDTLVVHTPHSRADFHLPWTFSTFDYRELCGLLWGQCDAEFETAKVEGRSGLTCIRIAATSLPRWWSTRWVGGGSWQPMVSEFSHPRRRCRVASRSIRAARAMSSRSGSTESTCRPATAGAFPQATRFASASARSILASTSRRRRCSSPATSIAIAVRYQGNWIPHKLRAATGDGIFFVGDSAGHCLPLTAEGIRTAFYFGIACGRELRRVVEGRANPETALRRYGDFSARHQWQFEWMLRVQKLVPRVPPRLLAAALSAMERGGFVDWSFGHYLKIAHPSFARAPSRVEATARALSAA